LTIDLSDSNNQLQQIKYSDPTNLAKKIGGLLKTIKFTTPKDSLYTFVELFLFKYLSDINILSSTENFDYILNLYGKDYVGISTNQEKKSANYFLKLLIRPHLSMDLYSTQIKMLMVII